MYEGVHLVVAVAAIFVSSEALAQAERLVVRVDQTKDDQPHWITPVATTTPRLEEDYRYDQLWQSNAKGVVTDNYAARARTDPFREGGSDFQRALSCAPRSQNAFSELWRSW